MFKKDKDITPDSTEPLSKKDLAKIEKEKNRADKLKKKESKASSPPNDLIIGFYEGDIKKKDLLYFLKNKAEGFVTPITNAFYSFKPYHGGFLWEIHDGGGGLSILPFVIESFEKSDTCIFSFAASHYAIKKTKVKEDSYQVSSTKFSASKVETLTRDNVLTPYFRDKMKRFVHHGSGLFVFSLCCNLFAILALVGSFHITNLKEHQAYLDDLYTATSELPLSKFIEIKRYMNNEENGNYISELGYTKKTHSWLITPTATPGYNKFKDKLLLKLGKDTVKNSKKPEINAQESAPEIEKLGKEIGRSK